MARASITENYRPEGVYAIIKGKGGETKVFPRIGPMGEKHYACLLDGAEFESYYDAVQHAIQCLAVPQRAADPRSVVQNQGGATP
jgi:hypothetical protein